MLLPSALPASLSQPAGTETQLTETGPRWDYAFGELPFLSAAGRGEHRIVRQTAPWKRDQFDNSSEAGEQSLTGWWYRSQATFHGGAGQLYLDVDPREEGSTTTQFYASQGVNPWEPGRLTMLPGVTTTPHAGITALVPYVAGDGSSCALGITSTSIYYTFAESGTVTQHTFTGDAQPLLSACTNGTELFVATSTAVYKAPVPANASTAPAWGTALWNTGASKVVLGWVKQRLVGAIGTKVYELVGSGPALPATAKYDHPNPGWTWTGITETGGAIYAGGYAGSSGAVFRFSLDTSGTMPTLTSGTVAAQLPSGEQVHSVFGYIGTFVAIGTNHGPRIAATDDQGNLEYGPILVDTATVKAWSARDRFLWFTAAVDGEAGLYRVDLSADPVGLRFPYATDLVGAGDNTSTLALCHMGAGARIAFSSVSELHRESTSLVQQGWLQTSRVRFGTLEPKLFKFVRLRGPSLDGPLAMSIIDDGGAETSLYTYANGQPGSDDLYISRPRGPMEHVSLKFTLNRNASTLSLGAEMHSYQLKALPGAERRRLIKLPLLCFDREEDRNGLRTGRTGTAYSRLRALEELERGGDTILFQDLTAGEQYLVVIEELVFEQEVAPGFDHAGWGGVITATLRTIV